MSIPSKYTYYANNSHHFNFQNSKYDTDRLLYDRLLAEGYNHYGVPMVYYKASYDTAYNKIFGEDNNRTVERKFEIMVYYTLPGEVELWSKFGIEGIDNFHMYISKKHFAAESTTGLISPGAFSLAFSNAFDVVSLNPSGTKAYEQYSEYQPLIGDIIKAKYNDYYYEIVSVLEQQEQFLQHRHSWDLVVKPYKDEKLSMSAAISADSDDIINDITNNDDILDASSTISHEVTAINYDPPDTEENPDNPFGEW